MNIKFALKGLLLTVLGCLACSQLAWAQEVSERGTFEGLNDPKPNEFYCQVSPSGPGCAESQACEDAVCSVDSFCCNVEWDNICVSEAQQFSECQIGETEPEPIARFKVSKFYTDSNPGAVEVTISCNTGLPLEQSDDISPNDPTTFVVRDFADGEMDCEISESVPAGYRPEYYAPIGVPIFMGTDGCEFTDVGHGLNYDCDVLNINVPSTFKVTKEWIDENPQFNAPNVAEANYSCSGELGSTAGTLDFFGTPDSDTESFSVFPHWDGGTTCTVTESVVEGGVEADDSDCQSVSVTLGNDASCTIVNTRLYEGIPTLSQYGLGLLALMMLGVGFVAFRRMS